MSPKRGERVAPPAAPGSWEVRFGTSDAVKGWEELCNQAPGNTAEAWAALRSDPMPHRPTPRHHQLKGELAAGVHKGRAMPRWQIEVTGAARIWYLADVENHVVWLVHAGTGHPKATER